MNPDTGLSEQSSEKPVCAAFNVHGNPCRQRAITGRRFCVAHDPEMERRHREGSRRGGMRRSGAVGPLDVAGLDLATLDGLKVLLARCLAKAAELSFNEQTANAVAVLAAQLRQLLQDAELEKRIAALEKSADTPARTAGEPESWTT